MLNETKKNILFITYRSDLGGGPKHLYDLIKALSSKERINCFMASPLDRPFGPLYQKMAKKHFALPSHKFSIFKLWHLRAWAKKNKIDIIHSHGRGAGLYSRMLKSTKNIIIHTFHGVHSSSGFFNQLKLSLEKVLLYRTDLFICSSVDEKEKALQLKIAKENQVVIIANGINLQDFPGQPPIISKEPTKKINLGLVTRLDPIKGIDQLFYKFKNLLIFYPKRDFHLHIAGCGEQEQELKALIYRLALDSNITMHGPIHNIVEFLTGLDIFISHSHMEGMPLSVLEAMACHIPCLLSDVMGHNVLIENGTNGVLFEFNDGEDFNHKLLELIDNVDKTQQYTASAYKSVNEEYSLSLMCEKVINIYNKYQNH